MAANLIPPSPIQGISQSPVAETASIASSANIPATQILLERSEIDKSLKSLEGLISILYDYAQLWQNLVALDKKLVKAVKDASGMKRMDAVEWPCNVLSISSLIFESAYDVDSKYSKLVEREYESCAQELKKWVKKLKKEDKALEEYTSAANAKIKAAGQAYEKKSKKGISSSPSSQSLDSYSALLSTLSSSVANAKHQHTLFTSDRHVNALYTISGSVGRMADAQWMKTCDLLRRCAGNVGPLGEGRSYVEAGWKGGVVVELPLNLPVQKTQETIAQPSEVSAPQVSENETPTIKPPPNRLPIPGPAVNSASSAVVLSTPSLEGKSRSSHAEMVEQIAEELKNSAAPPKDAKQDIQQTPKEAIQKKPSDQEIPKSKADVKQVAKPPLETISSSQRDAAPTTISSGTTNTDRSDITKSSNATSSKDTDTDAEESEYKPPTKATATSTSLTTPRSGALVNSSELGKADTPPKLPMEKKADDILMPKPLMARSSTNQTLESLESTHPQRFPDIGVSSPSSQQISYNPTLTSPSPIFAAHSTTGQSVAPALQPSQPIPPSLYSRKPVGRTMSIDSTGSAGGVVSALRERYTSPPPPAQAMATPRESFTPRDGAGRVSDMASRFTPIEHSADIANFGYGRDGRYPRLTSPSSPPLSRGMGNQTHDSLPIRRPLGPSAIDEFGKPIESGRRGPDPTPNAELRRPPLKSSTMGSSTMNSNAHSEYDIRLSELELQQRELELQRGRLQLAREREALLTRERDAQDSVHDSEYSSGREGASFRGGWGAAVSPPLSHGESYDGGRYGNREGFYDSSLRQGIHADSYDQYRREGYESQGRGTPRGGESITFRPYGEGGRYVDETRAPGSHTPSMADYSSIGQSMMGLGPPPPPPGASLAGMHSRSRENLMGTAGPKSQQLSPPVPKPSSTASRSSREPSPRRSADAVPSSVGKRYNEKEKGGTWLKGLKRLSMPAVPNNGH